MQMDLWTKQTRVAPCEICGTHVQQDEFVNTDGVVEVKYWVSHGHDRPDGTPCFPE